MENRFLLTPLFLDQPAPGLEALACPSWRVNRPVLPEGDPRDRMAIVHEAIAAWVEETLKRGRRPVSIAGDCCTSIGVLAGLQRAGVHPTLIWFDAHFDVDVVSLAESPAQNYPAAGGPTAAHLRAVFGRLAETGRVAAVSVSTWNPDLDRDRRSERVSMDLLQVLIGEIIP